MFIPRNILRFSFVTIVGMLLLFAGCDTGDSSSGSVTTSDNATTFTYNEGSSYYPEKTRFYFRIDGTEIYHSKYDTDWGSFSGSYQFCQPSEYATYREYWFTNVDSEKTISLEIDTACAEAIPLVDGAVYDLEFETFIWGPLHYLKIMEEDNILFLGYTNGEPGQQGVFDKTIPCFSVQRTSLLSDHHLEKGDCYDRMYNTEITFSLNGESVTLHQGQTAEIGDYAVNLKVAREVVFPGDGQHCPDYAPAEISYTIIKLKQ